MLASYTFFLTLLARAVAGETPQPASAVTPRPLRSPAAAHSSHRAWLPCFVHHCPFGII